MAAGSNSSGFRLPESIAELSRLLPQDAAPEVAEEWPQNPASRSSWNISTNICCSCSKLSWPLPCTNAPSPQTRRCTNEMNSEQLKDKRLTQRLVCLIICAISPRNSTIPCDERGDREKQGKKSRNRTKVKVGLPLRLCRRLCRRLQHRTEISCWSRRELCLNMTEEREPIKMPLFCVYGTSRLRFC